jgi:hypothetical protein
MSTRQARGKGTRRRCLVAADLISVDFEDVSVIEKATRRSFRSAPAFGGASSSPAALSRRRRQGA